MSTNLNLVVQDYPGIGTTGGQPSPSQPRAFPLPTIVEGHNITLQHVENVVLNRLVAVQITGPGWIVGFAITFMKFMAKLTGSELSIGYLQVGRAQGTGAR